MRSCGNLRKGEADSTGEQSSYDVTGARICHAQQRTQCGLHREQQSDFACLGIHSEAVHSMLLRQLSVACRIEKQRVLEKDIIFFH